MKAERIWPRRRLERAPRDESGITHFHDRGQFGVNSAHFLTVIMNDDEPAGQAGPMLARMA